MKILEDLGILPDKSNRRRRYYIVECPKCLIQFKTRADQVNNKTTKTCKVCKSTKHGDGYTQLYRKWIGIKTRCYNPRSSQYSAYGERGVKLCASWQNYENFKSWSMNNGYKENLEIHRVDNDGNYEPSNCIFVTHKQHMYLHSVEYKQENKDKK